MIELVKVSRQSVFRDQYGIFGSNFYRSWHPSKLKDCFEYLSTDLSTRQVLWCVKSIAKCQLRLHIWVRTSVEQADLAAANSIEGAQAIGSAYGVSQPCAWESFFRSITCQEPQIFLYQNHSPFLPLSLFATLLAWVFPARLSSSSTSIPPQNHSALY